MTNRCFGKLSLSSKFPQSFEKSCGFLGNTIEKGFNMRKKDLSMHSSKMVTVYEDILLS